MEREPHASPHHATGGVRRSGTAPRGRAVGLRWKIVGVLLLAALLPLAIVCAGAAVVFRELLIHQTLELQRGVAQARAAAIDLYLAERLRALELAARLDGLERWTDPGGLQEIFDALSRSYPGAFVDLGVIDDAGRHLAYLGPYDLRDKNYADADWFRAVRVEGAYVSDVFLGYRKVPHCVLAVRRFDGARTWFVRATIDNGSLHALVRQGNPPGGDAFLLDAAGRYQTPPRRGAMLEQSAAAPPVTHQGVRDRRVVVDGVSLLEVSTWVKGGRWLLVIQLSERQLLAPVRRAMLLGGLVVLGAVLLMVLTTVLATWHLTRQIDRATAQRDALSRDLLRSARLASLGELAAGLAHEINNPLAIISAEQTNLGDLIEEIAPPPDTRDELRSSIARCRRQVERCAGITAKMLRFGRKSESDPRPVDLGATLHEITALMRKQTAIHDIDLRLRVAGGLPAVVLDPNELEQVLTNMINNSIHAIAERGTIEVTADRRGDELLIAVRDTGHGVPPEDLDRLFQPFFTTKPVGQGTGLGLAVCFGLVAGWGGRIEVASAVDHGTTFTIRVPLSGARPSGAPTREQRGARSRALEASNAR